MKSSKENLINRGMIKESDLVNYKHLDKKELLTLLSAKKAFERTIAVRLLVAFDEDDVLEAMVNRLLIENKLYTKIALTEEISTFGTRASKLLIDHLGTVGDNQLKELPEKKFMKSDYPLPRDIIARTICKIGSPALEELKKCMTSGERITKLEAIDAIGFISFYESDMSLKDDVVKLYATYEKDGLMLWKVLRAMQSFDDAEVIELLKKSETSTIKQHQWEATRSLLQISRRQK